MAKKTKYERDCSEYGVRECNADNVRTKGLCVVKNRVCVHVCDGAGTCKNTRDTIKNKKVCTDKMKNPCKKCKPKSCSQ